MLLIRGLLLLGACTAFAEDVKEWTPAHAMRFTDVGSVQVSPDGRWAVWTQRKAIMTDDKSEYLTHIYLAPSDGRTRMALTRGEKSAQDPRFSSDSRYVFFTSDRSGKKNIYRIRVDGGEAEQLTDWKGTVNEYAPSPDGSHLAFTAIEEDKEAEKRTKAKLDYRIVNEKPKNASLWLLALDGNANAKPVRIVDATYHVADLAWSPDSARIAFIHRPRPDPDSARNGDLAEVEIAAKTVREISQKPGGEASPVYSPDGRYLAYLRAAGARTIDGARIDLLTRATGAVRTLAATAELGPQLLGWTKDSASLVLLEPSGTRTALYRLPIDGPPVLLRREERGTISGSPSLNPAGTHLGFTLETPEQPREAYVWPMSGAPVRVSEANTGVPIPPFGRTEVITWKSKDGRMIEGLLTYPVNYTKGQRVPLLLNVHGGPAAAFNESFIGEASRYSIASFAQKGIAVLRPNPRGSTGYGSAVRQMAALDWGGKPYEDLMAGVDHVIALGIADPDRLAVMGWSYGGYMTAWIVTQTTRFKAAAVGAGITNNVSMYGTQDVPMLFEDYFGGPPWSQREIYRKHSPMEFVDRVKTPTLIMHGEQDDRVPVSQGYEFHRALERQGVETRMIVYPRTPHSAREPKFVQHIMEQHLEWAERFLLKNAQAKSLPTAP